MGGIPQPFGGKPPVQARVRTRRSAFGQHEELAHFCEPAKSSTIPLVRPDSLRFLRAHLCPWLLAATLGVTMAQQAPAPAGARVLLLPRKIVSGEHAPRATCDPGKDGPGVKGGDKQRPSGNIGRDRFAIRKLYVHARS